MAASKRHSNRQQVCFRQPPAPPAYRLTVKRRKGEVSFRVIWRPAILGCISCSNWPPNATMLQPSGLSRAPIDVTAPPQTTYGFTVPRQMAFHLKK